MNAATARRLWTEMIDNFNKQMELLARDSEWIPQLTHEVNQMHTVNSKQPILTYQELKISSYHPYYSE